MMHRAIHRFDVIFYAFQLHWRIHAFCVIRQMSGTDKKIFFGYSASNPAITSLNFGPLPWQPIRASSLSRHHAASTMVIPDQLRHRKRKFPALFPACDDRVFSSSNCPDIAPIPWVTSRLFRKYVAAFFVFLIAAPISPGHTHQLDRLAG